MCIRDRFVAVAPKCLFCNELKEAGLLRRRREEFALQNSAQLLALFEERYGGGHWLEWRRHLKSQTRFSSMRRRPANDSFEILPNDSTLGRRTSTEPLQGAGSGRNNGKLPG